MQLVPNTHFDVATDDVALFMAMEEEQSAMRSWDQDQELDYEQISKKKDNQSGQQSKNNNLIAAVLPLLIFMHKFMIIRTV